jgi:Sel1 repeat-containing protein
MSDTSPFPGRPAARRARPPSSDQGDIKVRPVAPGRPRQAGAPRSGKPGTARAQRQGLRWRDIQWVDFSSGSEIEIQDETEDETEAEASIRPTPPPDADSAPDAAPPRVGDGLGKILRQFARAAPGNGPTAIPGLASRFARLPVPRPMAPWAAQARPAWLNPLTPTLRQSPAEIAQLVDKAAATTVVQSRIPAPSAALEPASPAAALHPGAEIELAPTEAPAPDAPELSAGERAAQSEEEHFPASILTPVGAEAKPAPSEPSITQTLGAHLSQAGAALRRQREAVGIAVSSRLIRARVALRPRWPAQSPLQEAKSGPASIPDSPSLGVQLSQAGVALRRRGESVGIAVSSRLVRARGALRPRWPIQSPLQEAKSGPAPIPEPPREPPPPKFEPAADAVAPEPLRAMPSRASVLARQVRATALPLVSNDPERLQRWLTVAGVAIVIAGAAYMVGAMLAGWATSDTRPHAASDRPPNVQTAAPQPQQPPPPQAATTPPSDPVARAAFYLTRAKTGDPVAQYDLGVLYARGSGLVQDYTSAATWFHAAATQGNIDAQYNLGVLYERGLGVTANPIEAVNWYRSAADRNHAGAQYNLALAYAEGHGTEQDLAAAARWYQRAAQQGLTPAMINLAILYERGQGIDRSPIDAYAWYSAAAERGDGPARDRASELFRQFTDQDKAKAQGLAATIAATVNGVPPPA